MLASFFFRLVCLHLTNFFHYLLSGMLQRLQHLDEKVGIISGNTLLLLRSSPRSIDTFRLVELVLVGVLLVLTLLVRAWAHVPRHR